MYNPHLRLQQQLSDIREEQQRLPGLTISGVPTAEEAAVAAQQCGLRFRQRLPLTLPGLADRAGRGAVISAIVRRAFVVRAPGQDRRRHHVKHANYTPEILGVLQESWSFRASIPKLELHCH